MKSFILLAIICAIIYGTGSLLCYWVDQEAEAPKTEYKTFEVYDMTIEAWKELKK